MRSAFFELGDGDRSAGLRVVEELAIGEFGPVAPVLRVEIGGVGELFDGVSVVALRHQGAALAELDVGIEEIGLDSKGVDTALRASRPLRRLARACRRSGSLSSPKACTRR